MEKQVLGSGGVTRFAGESVSNKWQSWDFLKKFLLNLLRWHWLIKLYWFQVYNSITHHLYKQARDLYDLKRNQSVICIFIALCVHHLGWEFNQIGSMPSTAYTAQHYFLSSFSLLSFHISLTLSSENLRAVHVVTENKASSEIRSRRSFEWYQVNSCSSLAIE